jgi:hypothetical protein
MFQRAADVHDPLPPIREADDVVKMHREWVRISTPTAGQPAALWPRLVRLARCDVFADRLDHQNIVLNDAVTIFGEELTRLRVEAAPVLGESPTTAPTLSLP